MPITNISGVYGDRVVGVKGQSDPSTLRKKFYTLFEDFDNDVRHIPKSTSGSGTAVLQPCRGMVSTNGLPAALTACTSESVAGGAFAFTPTDVATEGYTLQEALVDPDLGDFFVEARLKVETVETTAAFKFGLCEAVSPDDSLGSDGAASKDQISMFYDTGSTTDGLLEYSVSKNTDITQSGAAGMAGAQMVSDTFCTLAIERRAIASEISFFFNGSKVATASDVNISDQLLRLTIAGDKAAMGKITVDYIYIYASRV